MDGSPRRYIPWLTIALAVANVIVFGIELAAGGGFMWGPTPQRAFELGANFGPVTLDGEPWRLLTSMFLHFGILHLAANMVFGLYGVGQYVEAMYGRAAYAAVYLVSGLTGSLASAIHAKAVSAGASGAIFGLMGAFVAFLIVHRDKMDPVQRQRQIRGVGSMIVLNIAVGLQAKGIDMSAHLGGLVGGFLVGLALEIRRVPGAARARARRALVVAVLGTGLVVGATYVVPHSAMGGLAFETGFKDFAALESKVLDRWNGVVVEATSLGDDEMARIIETEILPQWAEAKRVYLVGGGKTPALLDYIEARRDGWTTMLDGLRQHDTDAITRGVARMKDADAILKQLSPN